VSKPHIKHYEQEDKKCIIEFEICPHVMKLKMINSKWVFEDSKGSQDVAGRK